MVKPVNKVRKSAVLEHLLDLERQIRSELARARSERKNGERKSAELTNVRSRRSRMSNEPVSTDSDATILPEIVQRYLH
jgi:hypothetical protein